MLFLKDGEGQKRLDSKKAHAAYFREKSPPHHSEERAKGKNKLDHKRTGERIAKRSLTRMDAKCLCVCVDDRGKNERNSLPDVGKGKL